MPTRLEKTFYRLQAQNACFRWVFQQIEGRGGVVFELGLGLGRTYNHMRHYLPERRIIAFDRKIGSYPDCTPPDVDIIVGELESTLPRAARDFSGSTVLAHTDIGSFDRDENRRIAAVIGKLLPPALAPGALVMSDLPLELADAARLPLPEGAMKDRYYLYRMAGGDHE